METAWNDKTFEASEDGSSAVDAMDEMERIDMNALRTAGTWMCVRIVRLRRTMQMQTNDELAARLEALSSMKI